VWEQNESLKPLEATDRGELAGVQLPYQQSSYRRNDKRGSSVRKNMTQVKNFNLHKAMKHFGNGNMKLK
jgi:hypothetical protein